MSSTATLPTLEVELREGYATVGDGVKLHYVEAGDGPLVLLLHGFPEFWFSWRLQIGPLAQSGFRVVAPDMRGYNLSSRPDSVDAYGVDKLAADIRDLINWGGTVAWATAMYHPEVVERLAILNAAHPRNLNDGLKHPGQLRRLWYFFFFQLPALPDRVVRARNFRFFRRYQRDARPPYTPEETKRYVESWSQPGAPSALINYYREAVRQSKEVQAGIRPIETPTLVIWGQGDRYLGPKLAEPSREDVPGLDRVERLEHASHWVHHDEHNRVNGLLADFFAPKGGSQ
jgi:epoxide hydrolase 4